MSAQPVAGYPSKTAAVTALTEKGICDFEIARLIGSDVKSVAALRASAKRHNGRVIKIRLTDDEFNNLSELAKAEGWSINDEIKARCFNTDYLDPETA